MAAAIILAAMAGITLARPEDHRIAAGPTTDRTADTGRIDDRRQSRAAVPGGSSDGFSPELPVFARDPRDRRRTPRPRARAVKGHTVTLVICSRVTLRADANWRALGLAIFTADGSDAQKVF